MLDIRTRLHTFLHGKYVGKDEFGNRYYEGKKTSANGRKKRWVMYKGMAEPSKVPASWHGWLHYTVDEVLSGRYAWQKDHLPNLTGTKYAYDPEQGKENRGDQKYQAWKPN